jgi:hypothetical protein
MNLHSLFQKEKGLQPDFSELQENGFLEKVRVFFKAGISGVHLFLFRFCLKKGGREYVPKLRYEKFRDILAMNLNLVEFLGNLKGRAKSFFLT